MLSDEKIYRYLLGDDVVVGVMYNSPIPGRKDDTPSFGLYEKDGKILWKDFGLAHPPGNQAIHLLMAMKGVGMKQAKEEGEQILKSFIGKPLTRFARKGTAIPQLKLRDNFFDFELNYWKRFGIFEPQLRYEDVFPLDSLKWITPEDVYEESSTEGNPAFIYKINDGWKRYRPLVKKGKWLSHNLRGGVIEGWNTFTPGELNLVVSSTKDRMVVKNCGYQVINPSAESLIYPFLNLTLPGRTIIMFDSDQPGYEYSEKLSGLTGWEYIDMRGKLRGKKDFAEYREKYNDLCALLTKLISI